MLRAIRRDERKRGALASYAFIVQEEDIKELIETIWHGHSILSQCDVRKELRSAKYSNESYLMPIIILKIVNYTHTDYHAGTKATIGHRGIAFVSPTRRHVSI